jgi:hypothetical protein
MHLVALLLLLSIPSLAQADKVIKIDKHERARLPNQLVLQFSSVSWSVRRGQLEATLPMGSGSGGRRVAHEVRLSNAGTEVTISSGDDCGGDFTTTMPLAHLEARLANAAALKEHRKGRFKAAALGFARAQALDPSFDLATTNLACALARDGRTKSAIDTLRPLLITHPVTTYDKILRDSDLASLRSAPELQKWRASKKGDASVSNAWDLAYSAELKLLAVRFDDVSYTESDETAHFIWFVDVNGKVIAELHLGFTEYEDSKRQRAQKRKLHARMDRLLGDLGFSSQPAQNIVYAEEWKAYLPSVRLGVTVKDGILRVIKADQIVGKVDTGAERILGAAYFPRWGTIVSKGEAGYENCGDCDTGPYHSVSMVAVPADALRPPLKAPPVKKGASSSAK